MQKKADGDINYQTGSFLLETTTTCAARPPALRAWFTSKGSHRGAPQGGETAIAQR